MKDWIKSGGYKKGQAVMEYLITYGLALFVILIVLAILVAVVLPSLQAPETCQFTQPGFGCSSKKHVLVSESNNEVNLIFQLDNQQGKSVKIIDVLCSSTSPANIRKSDVSSYGTEVNMTITGGESLSIGAEEADITEDIECVDESGSRVVLPPGSNFKGSIGVTYEFTDEVPGAPDRLAVATVTGNTQEG